MGEAMDIVEIPNVPTREQIKQLERELIATGAAIELEVIHHFAPGLYARELRIPAGTVLTGKTHKTTHLNVVSAGDITVWTEGGMKRVQAPYTFVSHPGTKRAGLTHADTVWTTFHVTNETDLEKIEAEVIEPEDNLLGADDVLALAGESE